ncbi:hypothetical protein K439DRAFT_1370753 [Ramaria rubella]|nr:hypothetical protein K439DRAFT_1370753 [Ramaria rubella]
METWKQTPSSPSKQSLSSTSSSLPQTSRCDRNRRPVPPSLRLDTLGVNPSSLIGKVLRRVVRSPRHPTITLQFADSTVFQIHVEGYNPHPALQGIPKELEMDSSLDNIMSACGNGQSSMDLLISDCALVRLTDKAFEKKTREEKWDQSHLGLAFKFEGDTAWHCVWAAVVEHDTEVGGGEIFRSYEDVYLQPILTPASPNKSRFPWRQNRNGK